MDFFIVPTEVLDLPDKEPNYEPVCDRVFCDKFYQAINAIATKHHLDYMTVRSAIVKIYKEQETFSVYGLCRHALGTSGYVVDRLKTLAEVNHLENLTRDSPS